jgi:hypothetical protein
MSRANVPSILSLCAVAAALLLVYAMPKVSAQQPDGAALQSEAEYLNQPMVEDWSHHYLIFSNPGTLENAQRNGKEADWRRIVSDPRYRMQWVKRYGTPNRLSADDSPGFEEPRGVERDRDFQHRRLRNTGKSVHADWNFILALESYGVSPGRYPAKYTFAPISAPDCVNDFVVFPIDANGAANQADLVGVNNLYETTCSGTVPTVLFSYDIGTGDVQTSPVLSLDGTKVAFIESISGGSNFHVLTLDKSGNAGCPSANPCNGNAYDTPVVPCTVNGTVSCTTNSADDTKITLSGGVMVTRSSPFVDYANDVAYVGDDTGKLHKITGVFLGTPTEVTTSPWPVTVEGNPLPVLSAAVYDSVSQNIFIGGDAGNLHCVTSAGVACSTPSINAAANPSPGPIVDAPIVDSTNQTVYAAASNSSNSYLTQVTTALGSPVRATMGEGGTDLYDGAFDNAYFTSVGSGHMYFCGNLSNAGTPVLYRIGFDSSGTMNSANDGNSFQLVNSGQAGASDDCTPLTEAFNASSGEDFLFLGVTANGFSPGGTPTCTSSATCTPNCAGDTCIMVFSLPTSSPFTFPTGPVATGTNANLNLGADGLSGIIIDNFSGESGASEIYFSNLQQGTGVQASQAALQ